MLAECCPVCMASSPCVYLSPCAHSFCERCVARLIARGPDIALQCPICRRTSSHYVRHEGGRYEVVHRTYERGHSTVTLMLTNTAMFVAGYWFRQLYLGTP